VPHGERGARLTEQMQALRELWRGEPATFHGRHYDFTDVLMRPASRTPGGPPMWVGGRSDAALKRAATLADGFHSYVVTPDMYRDALSKIEAMAQAVGRQLTQFGTGHLLFARIDDSYEQALDTAAASLGKRYAMDFRKAAQRYAALGTPAQVAETIRKFHAAGVRHLVVDLCGPYERRQEQVERFATETIPLLKDLTAT